MDLVEILSVHYKTPDLIYKQYESVRKIYPETPYRIIDGSDDGVVYFADLEAKDKHFKVERLGYNIHHGPGMDYAIRNSMYDFLLILDSDVSLKKPLIEMMLEKFRGYAVGQKRMVSIFGRQPWEDGLIGKLFPKIYKYTYILLLACLSAKKPICNLNLLSSMVLLALTLWWTLTDNIKRNCSVGWNWRILQI